MRSKRWIVLVATGSRDDMGRRNRDGSIWIVPLSAGLTHPGSHESPRAAATASGRSTRTATGPACGETSGIVYASLALGRTRVPVRRSGARGGRLDRPSRCDIRNADEGGHHAQSLRP